MVELNASQLSVRPTELERVNAGATKKCSSMEAADKYSAGLQWFVPARIMTVD